jgi:hypothetical protein
LLLIVDINPPVIYSVQQREAEENRGSLRALIFGMLFRIFMTSEDGPPEFPILNELKAVFKKWPESAGEIFVSCGWRKGLQSN